MSSETSPSVEAAALGSAVRAAIAARYDESEAARYEISIESFAEIVAAVVFRYAWEANQGEQLEFVTLLRVRELVLARACSAGNDAAWELFLTRFRSTLYETAYRIAKDEATGRELADGLYAELYGITDCKGRRVSKLDYYMGRGSLEGWLRTVLAQSYIDRYRAYSKEVSLEEQVESGVSFAAPAEDCETAADARISAAIGQSLSELSAEERFLLASYYLDRRTLAEIGRQLGVHESTISRKLDRVMVQLRRRVRKKWQAAGLSRRRCDELLQELDVRDLSVNVAANLRQENSSEGFYKKEDSSVT